MEFVLWFQSVFSLISCIYIQKQKKATANLTKQSLLSLSVSKINTIYDNCIYKTRITVAMSITRFDYTYTFSATLLQKLFAWSYICVCLLLMKRFYYPKTLSYSLPHSNKKNLHLQILQKAKKYNFPFLQTYRVWLFLLPLRASYETSYIVSSFYQNF